MHLLRNVLILTIILSPIIVAKSQADNCSIIVEWERPKTLADDYNCDLLGSPLPDHMVVEYIVNWRYNGESEWKPIDITETQTKIKLSSLNCGAKIEYQVGARWPGEDVFCPSSIATKIATNNNDGGGGCSTSLL